MAKWTEEMKEKRRGVNNPNWRSDVVRDRECVWCKKGFVIESARRKTQKFCSISCSSRWKCKNVPNVSFQKGSAPRIKPETYKRFRTERLGEGNPNWKGDKVSIHALHDWIRWNYGEERKCEKCGTENAKIYDWSNISGKYSRNKSDWQRLCRSCHLKYDYKFQDRLKKFMSSIKILKEDKRFSLFIRTRDKWTCNRCHRKHEPNSQGMHNSHFITRGNWAVRFDEFNCDALCYPCHNKWGGDDRAEYKQFKIDQLGEEGFAQLIDRSNEHANKKKVKVWAYLYYKDKLDTLASNGV